MRWSMKLSELNFEIVHRAGKEIPHVDALSRHVCAVLNDLNLSREVVHSEQAKDKFCQSLNTGAYHSKQEFFIDQEGLIYRRRSQDRHQLVVPQSLIQDVIRANHEPSYIAHPGIKRTHNLVALNYWWIGMYKSIADYVSKCDSCQKRKEDRQFTAPLGTPESPERPFQITSMDITGPYPLTARRNKYLLTFVDHFSKYAEAYPIPDQSAEVCARVYAREIVTRHGTGSVLVTDQGGAFMSSFFSETCKVLGIQRIHTSSFHPESNGMAERWHRTLHTGLSHLVNSTHTDWDIQLPFFLMAYRGTPHTTTGYSPFYLLHGREMSLPGNDNLKAKVATKARDIDQRIESLKATLRSAFRSVKQANKKSHERNKKYHDRRAKHREFEIGDLVYLYQPTRRPGLSAKFFRPWGGPFQVTAKLSDLNYEIQDQYGKRQIVHINRLKAAHDPTHWKPRSKPKRATKSNREIPDPEVDIGEAGIAARPIPIRQEVPTGNCRPLAPATVPPEPPRQVLDTPSSERADPSYFPPTTPNSRKESQPTRNEPPVTRARARLLPLEDSTGQQAINMIC
jgi:transposase InsO family protein